MATITEIFARFTLTREGKVAVEWEIPTVNPLRSGGSHPIDLKTAVREGVCEVGRTQFQPVAIGQPEWARPFIEQEATRQLGGGMFSARLKWS